MPQTATDIRLVLVEDQRLFREGLSALLAGMPEFTLLGTYENGKAFLDALPALPQQPHVALIDLNMPELNGLELTQTLQNTHPDIKAIMLTAYDQERFVVKMIEAGACAYLPKNCETRELAHAIKTVHTSGYYLNDAFLKAMRSKSRHRHAPLSHINHIPIELTAREREVLLLICKEFTNAEIAQQLHLSARTVDGHRNNLLAKTGARNTAGLVIFALSNRLLELPFT